MKRIEEKGITLIALVITIIVLLILAAVSITTLTGQNGILSRAGEAVEETGRKTAEEKVAVEVLGSYGKDGNIDYDLLNENLKNVEGLTSGLPIIALPKTVVVDGYNVTIDIEGNVEVENENPSSGESEAEAMVLDYGKRVNYISKVDDSLTWRIFYDDENYVYLISSKADGSGTVKNFSLLMFGKITSLIGSYMQSFALSLFSPSTQPLFSLLFSLLLFSILMIKSFSKL